MKTLTYIFHDCFVYEDRDYLVVFDYWKDPTVRANELPLFITRADKSKHLVVLVSHHHKDHYTKKIFEWEKLFRNVTFILSRDTFKFCRHILNPDSCYAGYKPKPENVRILKEGDKLLINGLGIEVFGSTDIGNSYILTIKGETLFHAGDLNAWIWKDESTPEEVSAETEKFLKIVRQIKCFYPKLDIVMFPVDARIGSEFYRGAELFVREIEVNKFFPMHFELYETSTEERYLKFGAVDLSKYANPNRGEYICLMYPYAAYLWE